MWHGGVIFAWGESDIDDSASGLHERYATGPLSVGRYHTVDTGKLTTAPMYARAVADRIRADPMTGHVTIGVPVYRGERFVAEAVDTVLAQTYDDWDVVFSVDGPDPGSEAVCRRYLDDPRFRLVVQPERLGWVRNIAWLQEQATAEFWVYLQQDDLLDPTYLSALMQEADRSPDAAVVYCDIQCFGTRTMRFVRPSILGSPVARMLSLLTDHFAGVAFRGLTRVRRTQGDRRWTGRQRRRGLRRRSRLDRRDGELGRTDPRAGVRCTRSGTTTIRSTRQWGEWDLSKRRRAWTAHCHDILAVAMALPSRPTRALAALVGDDRAAHRIAGHALPPWDEFTDADRVALVDDLIDRIVRLDRIDLRERLGSRLGRGAPPDSRMARRGRPSLRLLGRRFRRTRR